jgi:hypothetical protein
VGVQVTVPQVNAPPPPPVQLAAPKSAPLQTTSMSAAVQVPSLVLSERLVWVESGQS